MNPSSFNQICDSIHSETNLNIESRRYINGEIKEKIVTNGYWILRDGLCVCVYLSNARARPYPQGSDSKSH